MLMYIPQVALEVIWANQAKVETLQLNIAVVKGTKLHSRVTLNMNVLAAGN